MRRKTALLLLSILTMAVPPAGVHVWGQVAWPEMKLKVGDMAPDFTLPDDNGGKVQLSSFRGKKNVALAFYIFAFTGG